MGKSGAIHGLAGKAMDVPKTNLLEFIGIEQTNLLVSMGTCHDDIAKMFPILDEAYQAPLGFIDIRAGDDYKNTILSLYLFTHYHLYFSTICLLRRHLSDSLASTRKAIDATLSAYRLIEEPATLLQYHERHRNYQNIKSYVLKQIEKDQTKFSLATELIKLHDLCSEYGSHADIGSFVYRVSIEPTQQVGKGLFKLNMFQAPENEIEFRGYMVQTLLAYTQMVKIFSAFVGTFSDGLDVSAWIKKIDELVKAFASETYRIEEQLKSAAAASA